MTAQQQLAELNAAEVLDRLTCCVFIDKYGPAIAELVEAAEMSVAASKSMDATGLERSRAQYALEYHLRKLTQDATP